MVEDKAPAVHIWIQLFLLTFTTSLEKSSRRKCSHYDTQLIAWFQLKLDHVTTRIGVRAAGVGPGKKGTVLEENAGVGWEFVMF